MVYNIFVANILDFFVTYESVLVQKALLTLTSTRHQNVTFQPSIITVIVLNTITVL